MNCLRALSRSIPRAAFRPHLSSFRAVSSISQSPLLRRTLPSIPRPSYSAFSTSCIRKEQAGDSDQELSAKLGSERDLEAQSGDTSTLTSELQAFLDESSFKLEDKPGVQEVTMTREFGNETVKVTFSIADINNLEETEEEEDHALEDEEDFGDDSVAASSKRAINQPGSKDGADGVDDGAALAEHEEDETAAAEGEQHAAYPIGLTVTITKPGKGAVEIEASTQDGMVEVLNVAYLPNADLVDASSADNVYARQAIYPGPQFANLDMELQTMLERYLEERGVDSQLALFVPDYVEFKEQREYVQWLKNLQSFVDE